MKINICPHCQGYLKITGKMCQKCGLQLEASFDENPLVMLPRDDQDFLLDFVLCAGNFKALSEKLEVTYPTLRARLNRIIDRIRSFDVSLAADAILEAIEQGAIDPEDGIEQIKQIKKRGAEQ
jgi:hypothetical protein